MILAEGRHPLFQAVDHLVELLHGAIADAEHAALAAVIDRHRGQGGVLSIRYRAVEQLDEVIRRLEKWVPAFGKDQAARRG